MIINSYSVKRPRDRKIYRRYIKAKIIIIIIIIIIDNNNNIK